MTTALLFRSLADRFVKSSHKFRVTLCAVKDSVELSLTATDSLHESFSPRGEDVRGESSGAGMGWEQIVFHEAI